MLARTQESQKWFTMRLRDVVFDMVRLNLYLKCKEKKNHLENDSDKPSKKIR